MTQLSLIPVFDGASFDVTLDGARLTSQLVRVKELMLDGNWRTLRQIQDAVGGGSEAGISARLRDLRKPRFGGYVVEHRRLALDERGIWEYRIPKGQL